MSPRPLYDPCKSAEILQAHQKDIYRYLQSQSIMCLSDPSPSFWILCSSGQTMLWKTKITIITVTMTCQNQDQNQNRNQNRNHHHDLDNSSAINTTHVTCESPYPLPNASNVVWTQAEPHKNLAKCRFSDSNTWLSHPILVHTLHTKGSISEWPLLEFQMCPSFVFCVFFNFSLTSF